ncbi:MAG: hypothetical protein JWN98_1771 [Abditibacteriota bacterium]|jgi:hypothetical protein|nr:hypothetical protein [Abditibacteriota bacterium]
MIRPHIKVLCTLSLTALVLLPASIGQAQNDGLKPGLQGEYFDRLVEVTEFPVLSDTEKADLSRVDATIDWESVEGPAFNTPFADFFYARWTGKIRIPRDGEYTFFTESDDGSRVFINGRPVVDNGGTHGMEEKSGKVELKAGDHDLKVDFFENSAGAGCRFRWSGPGIEKQIVPAAALFHAPKD